MGHYEEEQVVANPLNEEQLSKEEDIHTAKKMDSTDSTMESCDSFLETTASAPSPKTQREMDAYEMKLDESSDCIYGELDTEANAHIQDTSDVMCSDSDHSFQAEISQTTSSVEVREAEPSLTEPDEMVTESHPQTQDASDFACSDSDHFFHADTTNTISSVEVREAEPSLTEPGEMVTESHSQVQDASDVVSADSDRSIDDETTNTTSSVEVQESEPSLTEPDEMVTESYSQVQDASDVVCSDTDRSIDNETTNTNSPVEVLEPEPNLTEPDEIVTESNTSGAVPADSDRSLGDATTDTTLPVEVQEQEPSPIEPDESHSQVQNASDVVRSDSDRSLDDETTNITSPVEVQEQEPSLTEPDEIVTESNASGAVPADSDRSLGDATTDTTSPVEVQEQEPSPTEPDESHSQVQNASDVVRSDSDRSLDTSPVEVQEQEPSLAELDEIVTESNAQAESDAVSSDFFLQSSDGDEMTTSPTTFKGVRESSHIEPPCPVKKTFLLGHSGQPESMESLSISESKRYDRFRSELSALKTEWSCYRGLVDDTIFQINQADALIQKSQESLEIYADSMRAVSNDTFVDDHGGVVQWARRKDRIAAQRNREAKRNSRLEADSSILQFLFVSFDKMVERLEENLPALRETAEDMAAVKMDVLQKAEALKASAACLLGDLELYEESTEKAWDVYKNSTRAAARGSTVRDRWLSEASYKSATKMTLCAWEIRCRNLKLVYEQAFQLAEYSRDRLKESLLAFLPRRRRFFLRVPEALEASALMLDHGRTNRDQTDANIEEIFRQLSLSNLKKENMHQSSIMNRSRGKQPDLKAWSDKAEIMKGGAFESKLVLDVKVFEVKKGRSWSYWKLTLGVFTAGNYLHLFDVHDDSMQVNLGNATVEEVVSRVKSTTPDLSLVLTYCDCTLDCSKLHVDISPAADAGKFQLLIQRKISLRLSTFAETSTWIGSLTQLREDLNAAELSKQAKPDEEARARLETKQVFV